MRFFRTETEMSDRNSLLIACKAGDEKLLEEYIAKHQDRNDYVFLDEDGFSPLHLAIFNNNYKIVEILLKTQLVDLQQKTSHGLDCLTLASETSDDLIKLLIENDLNFELVNQCIEYGSFLMKNLNELQLLVETLKSRNYTVSNTMELSKMMRTMRFIMLDCDPEKFRYFFLENMNFLTNNKQWAKQILLGSNVALYMKLTESSNDEQAKWQEVLSNVFLIIFNEYPDDFPKYLLSSLSEMRKQHLNFLIDWCIEAWYLAESNDHRDLVEKWLKHPNGIQNLDIIMGLHSSVTTLKAYDSLNGSMYKQLVEFLFENASKWTQDDMVEVGRVFGPKLEGHFFAPAFYEYFSKTVGEKGDWKSENVHNILKIVDKMQIGRKIQKPFFYIFRKNLESCWLPYMAFSTRNSADNVLEALDDVVRKTEVYSKVLMMRKVIEKFHSKSSLQNLCRANIRKVLLELHGEEMSHSQLVHYVKLLGLPKKIERFVLFNYSGYDF